MHPSPLRTPHHTSLVEPLVRLLIYSRRLEFAYLTARPILTKRGPFPVSRAFASQEVLTFSIRAASRGCRRASSAMRLRLGVDSALLAVCFEDNWPAGRVSGCVVIVSFLTLLPCGERTAATGTAPQSTAHVWKKSGRSHRQNRSARRPILSYTALKAPLAALKALPTRFFVLRTHRRM